MLVASSTIIKLFSLLEVFNCWKASYIILTSDIGMPVKNEEFKAQSRKVVRVMLIIVQTSGNREFV